MSDESAIGSRRIRVATALNILGALVLAAAFGVGVFLLNDLHHLNIQGAFTRDCALLSGGLSGAWIGLSRRLRAQPERRPLPMDLGLVVVGSGVLLGITLGLGGYLNATLDDVPPESRIVAVHSKWMGAAPGSFGRHRHDRLLRIESWQTPGAVQNIEITRASYNAFPEKGGRAELAVHPGWLGYAWFVDATPVR